MRVTNEMRARAEAVAHEELGPTGLWDDAEGRDHDVSVLVRRILETALADIPDPEEVRAEIMEGLAYGRSVETQRAMVAEEKLEKVRAWIAKHDEGLDALPYDIAPDYGALEAILDSKEQP